MPSASVCWGIEVGSGSITALKLEWTGEGLSVLDFVILPHKKVLSTPGIDQADAMRLALGAFAAQYDLTGASLAVSVPGHSAFARFAKLPPVEPKKVPDIVKFEAVQQIPFPIDEVEWDYQTFANADSPDIEVGIFAITRDRIMERLGLFQDVGLVPDVVTLSPAAAYNAIAHDLAFNEATPGTIVLDIGTASTDLIIAEAGRVWIRTFPIGGHHFTEALVNAFQLSYPKAERLKREAESTKHARHVFQAMRGVFGDLAQDVQRSIGYYQSLHKDAKLTRLIGLGSTFRLPGIRKYLKQQLQMDVYRMEQFKRLSLDGPRAGEFQAATLNLATAYGLALQGLGMAALDANLMPTVVLREAMWRKKVKWFGVAAGIAVAAGAAMFVRPFLDSQSIAAAPEPAVISQVISSGKRLKNDAAEVTAATGPNLAASEMIALLDPHVRRVYPFLLDDVSRMIEAGEALSANWPERRAGAEGEQPEAAGPAFIVKELKAQYVPPSVARDRAGEAPGVQTGRVSVAMTVTTTRPDASRFAIMSLDQWLRSNAKRDGVPYEIRVAGQPVRQVGEPVVVASEDRKAPAQTQRTEAPRTRTGRAAAPPRGQVMGEVGSAGGVILAGGGEVSRADEERRDMESQAAELGKLAPLPKAPQPEPGTTITTFQVNWDAMLLPPPDTSEREPT